MKLHRSVPGSLLSLLVISPAAVLAQETRTVAGVVLDAQTGAPVEDVLVTLQGTALRLTIIVGESDQVGHRPLYTEIVHRAH